MSDVATGGGRLVFVVGPSGAGKDTLITAAKAQLSAAAVRFIPRFVTRTGHCADDQNVPVSSAHFDAMIEASFFALSWAANGLRYGIGHALDEALERREVAVVNGSRGAVPDVLARYGSGVRTVAITADRSVLEQRLKSRGREDEQAIRYRLDRSSGLQIDPHFTIWNDGPPEHAIQEFVAILRSLLAESRVGALNNAK